MTTPVKGAPELSTSQASKEATHNEALRYMEQGADYYIVADKDLTAPPGSPAAGDCYIVASGATGAWAGHDGEIAFYLSTSWDFITARTGAIAYAQDEGEEYRFDADSPATWSLIVGGSGTGTAALLDADTDGTLAANSDSRIATQKAVKTYVDNSVVGLIDLKGNTDCSANPNYPAASKGDAYYVTVAGKIGGAAGKSVDIGDVYIAKADNAGGTEASVGSSWFVIEHNIAAMLPLTGGTLTGALQVPDDSYDATSWNGNTEVPTKNAVRDKIEGVIAGVPSAYTDEMARDAIGAALVAGANVTITVNDGADTITIDVPTEGIQDIVGALLAAGNGITVTYNDAGNVETIAITEASDSETWTGTAANRVITPNRLFSAAVTQTLTDGATITIDGNTGVNFKVTLGGSRTLANPTNMKTGQSGIIIVTQDATGSRVFTYGSNWKFPGGAASGGVLSTGANKVDVISYYVRSDGTILATLTKDFS